MKKYVRIVIVLVFLFILFRFFFFFLYKGRTVNYVVKEEENKYYVYEEYIRHKKGVSSHYYIEIEFDETIFNFRLSDVFDRKSYVVDTIYSFQNEQYTCILPIFGDNSIQTDILCKKGDMIYPYRHLQNESLALDKFAMSMKEYGYLIDSIEEEVSRYGISIVENNISSSHTIVVPSYKGIYLINENDVVSSIELFENDVYTQQIQSVASNYYIVADYDSSYSFHTFKLVNLNTKKVSSISSDSAISMDSYVQGVVDNCVYIIDRSNRKQYEIDVSNKTVTLVGNSSKGILYYNGKELENKSIYDALDSDLIFGLPTYESSKYDYVYVVNDIYYSYLKTNDGYDVYVSYEENSSLYSYTFSISDAARVKYIDNFAYFMDKDTIYYYHPKNGIVQVLTYSELLYNSKLNFWVY